MHDAGAQVFRLVGQRPMTSVHDPRAETLIGLLLFPHFTGSESR